MPRIWNGRDLSQETPELGTRLASASLIPEFAAQVFGSGLLVDTDTSLIAPLDDLKQWLRLQPSTGQDPNLADVRDLLLEREQRDRAKAEKAGIAFDLVEYELAQMSSDESYERFDPVWVQKILALVLDEADALQAFSRAEFGQNFSLGVSFQVPDPRRHPVFKLAAIEAQLKQFGWQGEKAERSGTLLLELASRADGWKPPRSADTAFVRVALDDPRAGDATDASLLLAYPTALEGYFLMTFDALRQQLTLKGNP